MSACSRLSLNRDVVLRYTTYRGRAPPDARHRDVVTIQRLNGYGTKHPIGSDVAWRREPCSISNCRVAHTTEYPCYGHTAPCKGCSAFPGVYGPSGLRVSDHWILGLPTPDPVLKHLYLLIEGRWWRLCVRTLYNALPMALWPWYRSSRALVRCISTTRFSIEAVR